MFLLTKWYLDVATDDGGAAILHVARLRWGPIRLRYAGLLHCSPAFDVEEQSTRRDIAAPRLEGDVVTWSDPRLRVEASWRRDAPAFERRLAGGRRGEIVWMCHMPRALASVRIGNARLEGLGYVERLDLSIPPRRLPFRTLRWGRWLSPEHWLVWIDWANGTGGGGERWVWLDGAEQSATLRDGLPVLSGGDGLSVPDGCDLCDRPVLSRMGGGFSAIARVLAGPAALMHEHRRMARVAMTRAGRSLGQGWAVYEEVSW